MLRDANFVAERLNVRLQRVYAMVRNGTIPQGVVVHFGVRQIRFNQERLEDWIASGGNVVLSQRLLDRDCRETQTGTRELRSKVATETEGGGR